MWIWLIGVAIFVVIWGAVWRTQPKLAFGVLLGLPIAWVISLFLTPYVTGMHQIPVWLPPLPLAIVAVMLFVFGTVTWLRADRLPPPRDTGENADHEEHGGGPAGH
jgi:hypothetical protein